MNFPDQKFLCSSPRLQTDTENYGILHRAFSYIVESKRSLIKTVNYLIKIKFQQSYSCFLSIFNLVYINIFFIFRYLSFYCIIV